MWRRPVRPARRSEALPDRDPVRVPVPAAALPVGWRWRGVLHAAHLTRRCSSSSLVPDSGSLTARSAKPTAPATGRAQQLKQLGAAELARLRPKKGQIGSQLVSLVQREFARDSWVPMGDHAGRFADVDCEIALQSAKVADQILGSS